MADELRYDSNTWVDETGASTGDARLNDPDGAGFTDEDDRVFRSHYQQVNRLADRGYESVRPVYALGFTAARSPSAQSFEQIEKDLENGWLNVRVGGSDWATVREFARVGFDRARQGRVDFSEPIGTTPSHDRPSFSDPLPDRMDPTAPDSPEQEAGNGPA